MRSLPLESSTDTTGVAEGLRPRRRRPAAQATSAAGPHLRAVVVVPARDEEERIGACIAALAAQRDLEPGSWEVVLVLDGCSDDTAAVAERAAGGLVLHLVAGPGRGVGFARRTGMAVAAARLRAAGSDPASRGRGARQVIASTDADSVTAPDWLARVLAAVDAGAGAVGGRITLDPVEAAALPAAVLVAREQEAARRLLAVRAHAPRAGHHQFSGAALAVTLDAHDQLGGLPAVACLEDEALERLLRAAGIPIAYPADVRVTTSARTSSSVPRGLAQVLRTTRWQAAQADVRRVASPTTAGRADAHEDVLVVRPGDEHRGDALHRALLRAGPEVSVVVLLAPGVPAPVGRTLARRLRAEPSLQLVRGAEPERDPLAELVVRPALNVLAPELAVLTSPLTRTWAIRRELLDALSLPHGDTSDLSVLIDVWTRHGLEAIAEEPVDVPAPPARRDEPLAAYELLAVLAARLPATAALSSAFADADGVRRAHLDEHAPVAP